MLRGLLTATVCILLLASTAVLSVPVTPEANRRNEEQTFLTFPEWFLVYSPDEYAVLLRDRYPSEFPWWGHIGQFWSSYGKVIKVTEAYPFNSEYHVMINVIGVSTTVEYALRSAYETTLGRVGELFAPVGGTAEDKFAAGVAQDYVDFIRVRPWYEFDFGSRLIALWRDIPMLGPGHIRKWERRYALTTELIVKATYAWLIGLGTQSAFGVESPVTVAALDREASGVADVKKLADLDDGGVLVELPRYDAFKDHALAVARAGSSFTEIAGNGANAPLLVTVIAPTGWQSPRRATVLFLQPIITDPTRSRQALVVRVADLASLLASLDPAVVLEHVYDY